MKKEEVALGMTVYTANYNKVSDSEPVYNGPFTVIAIHGEFAWLDHKADGYHVTEHVMGIHKEPGDIIDDEIRGLERRAARYRRRLKECEASIAGLKKDKEAK